MGIIATLSDGSGLDALWPRLMVRAVLGVCPPRRQAIAGLADVGGVAVLVLPLVIVALAGLPQRHKASSVGAD